MNKRQYWNRKAISRMKQEATSPATKGSDYLSVRCVDCGAIAPWKMVGKDVDTDEGIWANVCPRCNHVFNKC